jgi:hypothetical protein
MKNDLKEKFIKKWNSAGNVRRNPEPIWNWIRQNYVSKEQTTNEVLKIVDKGIPVFFKKNDEISENNPNYKAIRYYLNELRSQIKEDIKNLVKWS